MVGREDEAHFIFPAGWWSIAGLVVSLIGVLLLIRFGMPYRVRSASRYEILGWLGLFLAVLGTICQIIGALILSAT
jgi:hypothetical protein